MENELFEKTKVSKAYMTLALPVVLGMVVSLIYNMVDTFFIARTGNTALIAGVSLGTPIFTLMIALGDIFGVGGSSVISRLFGKKEYEDGRRISVFCFYAAIAVGIAVSIILLAAKQPILGLLGCDETTWQYAGGLLPVDCTRRTVYHPAADAEQSSSDRGLRKSLDDRNNAGSRRQHHS